MKTLLLTSVLWIITAMVSSAQSIGYGLYSGSEETEKWGTGQIEDYDMAIYVPGEFAGMKVTAISVPYTTNQLENGSYWATTELALDENGKNKPDIVTEELDFKQLTSNSGFATVSFESPITIPAEGLYVGYSFSVTENAGWYGERPTVVLPTEMSNFFYMRSNVSHRKWKSRYESSGKGLAITAYLSGGQENAATISSLSVCRAETGRPAKVQAEVTNYGNRGIQSITYKWNLNGQFGIDEAEVNVPAHFGKTQPVMLDLPALETHGAYPLTVTIEKVNDAVNEQNASMNSTYFAYDELPQYRPLVEAYEWVTDGFGWRTFVGMDNMMNKKGNDFPGIIYFRVGDLSIASDDELPANMAYVGIPNAYINRQYLVDPYLGKSELNPENHFTFDKIYEEECENITVANISVAARFSDMESKNIGVAAKVEFPFGETDTDYAIGYVLTADSIIYEKEIPNNYANNSFFPDEDMSAYVNGPSNISHSVFNSVAVAMSPVPGVDGSIPSTTEDGVEYTHNYSFDISKNKLIQDKKKLNVVSFIIDRKTGYVINSCKSQVLEYDGSGVEDIYVTEGEEMYYSIDGRRLSTPQKGLNIVIHSDGRREKVIVK